VAAQLYRIGSEAVHNAVRHAEADHLDLSLETEDNRVVLTVEDDGKGFRTEEVSDKHGLQLMWYRADLIGARLRITSTEGEGTRVQCTLPQSRVPRADEA
jgi:two-component system CheB/CheR fusion protein